MAFFGLGSVRTMRTYARSTNSLLPLELTCRSGRILHITATLSEAKATDVRLAGEGKLVFTGLL